MLNKVTGYGQVKSTTQTKGRSSVSATRSFADLLAASEAGDAASVESLSGPNAAASLAGMLAIQEVSDEEIRRKRAAVRRGHDMLESLESLRHALLEGRIPPQQLRELERHLSDQRQQFTDPALQEVLDDIELRVAVELAKIETAKNQAV